tara:strand:- start:2154 stop:2420 length:267 start_codon:yes stop_codon:yes gene_type:complete
MLKVIKKHLVECGFDLVRDFLLEFSEEREYVSLAEQIASAQWAAKGIEDWDQLVQLLEEDEFGILGYLNLDDLISDVECSFKIVISKK